MDDKWKTLLKVLLAVVTALMGALGISAMV